MYQVTGSLPCGNSLQASIQSSRMRCGKSPGRAYQASQRAKSGRTGGGTAIADKFDKANVIFVMDRSLEA